MKLYCISYTDDEDNVDPRRHEWTQRKAHLISRAKELKRDGMTNIVARETPLDVPTTTNELVEFLNHRNVSP